MFATIHVYLNTAKNFRLVSYVTPDEVHCDEPKFWGSLVVKTSNFVAIFVFLISFLIAPIVVSIVGRLRGHYDFSDGFDVSALLWFPTLMAIIAFYAGKKIEKIWNGRFEFTSPIIYSATAGLIIAFLAKAILEHFTNLDGLNIYYGLLLGALVGIVIRFRKNKRSSE